MTMPVRVAGTALLCMFAGMALSLALFVWWLHAPQSHVAAAVQYFLASGLISLGAGVASLFIITRFAPRLSLKVAIASIFGSVAAIVNIVLTPLMMFQQRADFDILVITLLYFLAISLGFASIFSYVTTRQIHALSRSAARLAAGEYGAVVIVQGQDEIAGLGRTFNRLSVELDESRERRRRLEDERRDLVAAVSHDLRTPLTSIRAMVEALQDGVVDDPAGMRRYLHSIGSETARLSHLIDDLFELSRIESGSLALDRAPVALDVLVTEVVDGMRVYAEERRVALAICPHGQLPPVSADAAQLQRVFANLIENAVRHTPPGGHVSVEMTARANHLEVSVADTGEGIPADDLPYVFDRFFRGEKSRSRETGGAGLGLAIAAGIVAAHGGTIGVESPPGGGARFVVTLRPFDQ